MNKYTLVSQENTTLSMKKLIIGICNNMDKNVSIGNLESKENVLHLDLSDRCMYTFC